MIPLLVVLGAMVGAPLRYLTDRAVQTRHDSVLPWGTISVNVLGCLVFGGVSGAAAVVPEPVVALLGIGLCGALTTYSTFSLETLLLLEQRAPRAAAVNVAVSVLVGFGAAVLSAETVRALLG